MRKLKFSKGQAEAISGIVIGAVMLFIGLFMISAVSSATPEDTLKEYGYTTVTNSTDLTLNGSTNQTHNLAIGALVSIEGVTPDKTITTTVDNQNATTNFTVNVYLNGVALDTINALNGTTTTGSYTAVDWVASATNNLTYNTNNTNSEVFINSTAGVYPSSKTDTEWGSINTTIISTVGTIFSVLGLVLIVIALALAIGALRGSMIGGGRPVA